MEILVALAIIAIALSALVAILHAGVQTVAGVQEQTTAAALARSQMETIKSAAWPGPYPAIGAPAGYAVSVSIAAGPAAGLQLLTVSVQHDSRTVLTVQGLKAQR